jgi:hypothetical protein
MAEQLAFQQAGGGSIPTPSLHFYVERVVNKEMRSVARDFINAHHSYIKWADRPSRKMYWLLYENAKLVGVFGLGSAFARPKPVANYMKERALQFNEVANNIVYALFGCQDMNAGTRFLKILRRDAVVWWRERYGDDLKAFQTFILPPRTGAMYKADNWEQLGQTTGGRAQTIRTLCGEERKKHPEAEIRKFKSGEVKYLLREFKDTEPKLIFMRLR